jgi:hypothetical protein
MQEQEKIEQTLWQHREDADRSAWMNGRWYYLMGKWVVWGKPDGHQLHVGSRRYDTEDLAEQAMEEILTENWSPH